MTRNEFIEIPKIYEQGILEVEITEDKLPTIEEIKNGAKLPEDYIKRLFNPNANFNNDRKIYCSYSNCLWPSSVKFQIEICLDGWSRKWARKPNYGNFLSGSWELSPAEYYTYQKDLRLIDIEQARKVIPLIINDNVWTTNLWGGHCAEDIVFCNNALRIIRECIKNHENGCEIKVKETVKSEISRWSNFGLKFAGNAVASAILGPAALPIGTLSWGVGKIGENLCENDQGKAFFKTIGGIGGDVAIGELIGGLVSGTTQFIGHEAAYQIAVNNRQMTSGAKLLINTGKTIKKGKEAWDFYEEIGKPSWQIAKHILHLDKGITHELNCEICEN